MSYEEALRLLDECLTNVIAAQEAARQARDYALQSTEAWAELTEIQAEKARHWADKLEGRTQLFKGLAPRAEDTPTVD